MKKILFLTSNFPPGRTVGTQRVTKILKYIDGSEFEFHVLTLEEAFYGDTYDKNKPLEQRIPDSVKVYRTPIRDLTKGFTYVKSLITGKKEKTVTERPANSNRNNSVPGKPQNNKSLVSRLAHKGRDFFFSFLEFPDKYIGWYKDAVKEGVRIVREEKIDILLTTAPPHSLFVMATRIKKLTGVKLVLDYRDPWALSRWDKGSRIKTASESYLEKKAIKAADAALFVTDKLQKEYARHYQQFNPDKFHVFYNGYDADDFKGKQCEPTKPPLRFIHLGTLYKKRNPEKLFEAVRQLKEEGLLSAGQVQFEFIGYVARELDFLFDRLAAYDLDDLIIFKPNIDFESSLTTMYEASVLVIVQPFTDLQVPAKLLEYMYTERPILALCEPGSATAEVIENGSLGVVAASQDVAEIRKAILKLLDHLQQPQFKSDVRYIQSFNMKEYIKKLEDIFRSL